MEVKNLKEKYNNIDKTFILFDLHLHVGRTPASIKCRWNFWSSYLYLWQFAAQTYFLLPIPILRSSIPNQIISNHFSITISLSFEQIH